MSKLLRTTRIKSRLLFTFLFASFLYYNAQSQTEANHWIFGDFGLIFNGDEVTVNREFATFKHQASSSYTDENGNLLMYTDGLDVWNREHEIMAFGFDIFQLESSLQVVKSLILKKPGSENLFYVFTLYPSNTQESSGLYYSLVDMTLDDGKGAVVEKRQKILSTLTNKFNAIYNHEEDFYWIITRSKNSGDYILTKLNSDGFATPHVFNQIGSSLESSISGQLKFSPDGKMIACSHGDYDWPENYTFSLFDFDISTGVMSNAQIFALPESRSSEGIEFSSDGTKLYVYQNGSIGENGLYQFDLSNWPNDVAESLYLVGEAEVALFDEMQLAPDGKIYIAKGGGQVTGIQNIGIIHNPNAPSSKIEFEELGLNLEGGEAFLYTPNFPQDLFFKTNFEAQNTCKQRETQFRITNEFRLESVLWIFEEGMTSTEINPTYTFEESGDYPVTLIAQYPEKTDTIKKVISIHPIPEIDLGNDRALCFGNQLIVDPSYASYEWNTGATINRIEIKEEGQYSVTVTNEFGCKSTDVVNIEIDPLPVIDLPTYIPLGDQDSVELNPGVFVNYMWSTDENTQTILVMEEGWYSVVVEGINGCQSTKSVYVYQDEPPIVDDACNIINPKPTSRDIEGVVFINDNVGFSITDDDLLKSTDGGYTWQIQLKINFGRKIDFAENIGYMINRSGIVYKSTYEGGGWNKLNTLSEGSLNGLSVISADTVIVTSGSSVHRSYDGGMSWDTKFIQFDGDILSSHFQNSKLGYYATKKNDIYKTINGGDDWNMIADYSFNSSVGTIYFSSENIGFVSLDNDVYRTDDGGENWSSVNFSWNDIHSFFFLNEHTGFLAGEYGTRYKTIDGGITWQKLGSDPANDMYTLNSIFFFDENIGIAVGNVGRILRTKDGGTTWEIDSPTYREIDQLEFSEDNIVYILVNDELFKTNDFDDEWTNFGEISEGDNAYGIEFTDKNTGYAIVERNVFKSENGGLDWSKANSSFQIAPSILTDIEFVNELVGYVCTPSGQGGLYRTNNKGLSWSKEISEKIHSIHFISEETGFAIGDYEVFKTTDNGFSWNSVLTTDDEMAAIHFPNKMTGYVVGDENLIFKTSDGGETWIEVDSPSSNNVDVKFYSNNNGFALSQSGLLYQTTNGAKDWEKINNVLSSSRLNLTDKWVYKSGARGLIMRCDFLENELVDLDKPVAFNINKNSADVGSWIKSNLDSIELFLEIGTESEIYSDQINMGSFNERIDEYISFSFEDLIDTTQYFCRWRATSGNQEYTSEEASFITLSMSTGIHTISDADLYNIYPNPTNSYLTIQNSINSDSFSYVMKSLDGKLVLDGKSRRKAEINVSNINAGIYILELTQEGKVSYSKVVVE